MNGIDENLKPKNLVQAFVADLILNSYEMVLGLSNGIELPQGDYWKQVEQNARFASPDYSLDMIREKWGPVL